VTAESDVTAEDIVDKLAEKIPDTKRPHNPGY